MLPLSKFPHAPPSKDLAESCKLLGKDAEFIAALSSLLIIFSATLAVVLVFVSKNLLYISILPIGVALSQVYPEYVKYTARRIKDTNTKKLLLSFPLMYSYLYCIGNAETLVKVLPKDLKEDVDKMLHYCIERGIDTNRVFLHASEAVGSKYSHLGLVLWSTLDRAVRGDPLERVLPTVERTIKEVEEKRAELLVRKARLLYIPLALLPILVTLLPLVRNKIIFYAIAAAPIIMSSVAVGKRHAPFILLSLLIFFVDVRSIISLIVLSALASLPFLRPFIITRDIKRKRFHTVLRRHIESIMQDILTRIHCGQMYINSLESLARISRRYYKILSKIDERGEMILRNFLDTYFQIREIRKSTLIRYIQVRNRIVVDSVLLALVVIPLIFGLSLYTIKKIAEILPTYGYLPELYSIYNVFPKVELKDIFLLYLFSLSSSFMLLYLFRKNVISRYYFVPFVLPVLYILILAIVLLAT